MIKHSINRLILRLACSLMLSIPALTSFGSHIVGADLFYTRMSGSTYKVTIALYGSCESLSAAAFATLPIDSPQVCIYDGDTYVATIRLAIESPVCGVEVTPLCPGDTSQCMNLSSTTPGIKKFVYSGNFVLPHTSANWRFIYSGNNGTTSQVLPCSASGSSAPAASARAASITNLNAPSGTVMQLIDTLNNVTSDNSSPLLTVTQQTFFCLNQHNDYYPGAVDPDGDSLSISLTDATSGGNCGSVGGPVAYMGTAWPGTPVSAATPLQVFADSFSLNSQTGNIFFNPNVSQRGVVVYNIHEYRAGVLVGTSEREMTVLVLVCGTGFPCVAGSTLGLPATDYNNKVEIYPNPAADELTIKTTKNDYSRIIITNTLGQLQLQKSFTGLQMNIDIKVLTAGVYYITLKGDGGDKVMKFVKI